MAILMVVIGVAVRGLTQMQQIDFTQHEQTDAVQGTRDFIDQMVRDLHDVGYPPRSVFLGNPGCNTSSNIACTVIHFDSKQLIYEGDLDGSGVVYRVWVQLQPGPNNQCPCILQRGFLQKSLAMPPNNQTPLYFTEVNGVLNSGDGTGNATYTINLPGSGNYATYGATDVFQGFHTDASQFTTSCDIGGTPTCSDLASIRITTNTVSRYADQKTKMFKVYSITSRARINNAQFDN